MACPNQYYYDQYGYYLSYVYPQYPTPVQATCQTLNPPSSAVLQSPAGPGACQTYTPTVQTVYQATQPATDYTHNSNQGCPETPYYNSQYIPEYTDDSSPSAYTCTPTQSSTPTCTPNSIPAIHPPQTIPYPHPHPTRIFSQTDQDLIEQIKSLVETALSNAGLTKEPYLVKQISRSTTGFISLKLIASLRQVRRLTRNIQLIIEALRRSSILELSDDCHKVRRKEALPSELSRPKPISTILAIRVPEEDAEIDRLSAIFKVHGKIQQMRIVPPEKKLPNYLLGYATQVPELGTEMCAVVEFASDESAMAACKTFHHNATAENGSAASRGMRVALLGPRLKRNLYGNRRQSLSCQSSVISSLDVSLEECIIGGADNITDTDSGFHQAPRARIPSGSSESNTPRSEDESSPAETSSAATSPESTPPQSPDSSPTQKIKTKIETKNLTRRRNSEISKVETNTDSDSS